MNTTFKNLPKKAFVQELMTMKIVCSAFLIFHIRKALFLTGKWNA